MPAPPDDPVLGWALDHFGDVRGRRLLDLGCGAGEHTLAFAALGADVTAVDTSEISIEKLRRFCRDNRVSNVDAIRSPAQAIGRLGSFELAFGSFILHHIEPFHEFAATLASVLPSGGRAFFYENSAAVGAPALWFRQNLAGRFGFPKYGDSDEFPLTKDEIGELRRYFRVRVEQPTLFLFKLLSMYVLRGAVFSRAFDQLDRTLYRFPSIRGLSYRQCLYLERA